MTSYLCALVTLSPRFHGVSGEASFKSRFDWPLGLLPPVLLISNLVASPRSGVKFVGTKAFYTKMHIHTRTEHAPRTQTHKYVLTLRETQVLLQCGVDLCGVVSVTTCMTHVQLQENSLAPSPPLPFKQNPGKLKSLSIPQLYCGFPLR